MTDVMTSAATSDSGMLPSMDSASTTPSGKANAPAVNGVESVAAAAAPQNRIILRMDDSDDESGEEEYESEEEAVTEDGRSHLVDDERSAYAEGHEDDQGTESATATPLKSFKRMGMVDGNIATTTYTLDELPDYGLRGHELASKAELCDAILEAGGKVLHCHRFVLASSSQFFYKWFMSMGKDEVGVRLRQPKELANVDGDALETIIKSLYSREIEVDSNNVEALLEASDRVDIGPVWDACIDFLIRHLTPGNCLRAAELADRYSSEDLQVEAHNYLCQHFAETASHISWALLSKAQVIFILSSDELSLQSEWVVFIAVLNWVNHNIAQREAHLPELLTHVRLPWLNADQLRKVMEHPLVTDQPACLQVLMEGLLDARSEGKVPAYTPWLRPRKQLYTPEFPARLHAIGMQKMLVQDWSHGNPRWVEAPVPTLLAPMGAVETTIWTGWTALNGSLYLARHFKESTQLVCYAPHLDITRTIASPCHPRRLAAITVLDDRIYVLGGRTEGAGSVAVSTVDCYDVKTGQWLSVPPLQTARHSLGAAALDGCLYAVGGDRHEHNAKHSSRRVECFDPQIGKWSSAPKLTVPRSGVAVCVLDGSLYAVGGHAGGQSLSVVERYTPQRGRWQVVANMNIARAYTCVTAFNGCLYVADSYGPGIALKPSDSMECYDPATNKWTMVDCTDARPTGACGALLVL
eukprot:jgi/Chlat1/7301/Chrsp58S06930